MPLQNDLEENDLKATVHISATPTSNAGILLSEWYDSSQPADGTMDALRTNVKDTANGDHYSTEGKLYEVFTIKMWITRDNNSQGTQDEWDNAKGNSTKTATYTFSFDGTNSVNLAANDTAFFTDAANTLTYAKETANVKTLSCTIASMQTAENNDSVVGYFFVRIKGVGGTTTSHTSGTTYSAVYDATGNVA